MRVPVHNVRRLRLTRVLGLERTADLGRPGCGGRERSGGGRYEQPLLQRGPSRRVKQLWAEGWVGGEKGGGELGGFSNPDRGRGLRRGGGEQDRFDIRATQRCDLAGQIGVGRLDLLLDELQAQRLGRRPAPGHSVLAIVAFDEDVADLVTRGETLLLEQPLDPVNHFNVVCRPGNHHIRIAEQRRRPGRGHGQHLIALEAGKQRGDLWRAEQLVERKDLALHLAVRGDRLLGVVPMVLDNELDLPAADPAGGVLLVPVQQPSLLRGYASTGERSGPVGEDTQFDHFVGDARADGDPAGRSRRAVRVGVLLGCAARGQHGDGEHAHHRCQRGSARTGRCV